MWGTNNILVVFLAVALVTSLGMPAIAKGADDTQADDSSSSGSSSGSSTPGATPDDSPDDMSTPDDVGTPGDDSTPDDTPEGVDDKGGLVQRDDRQEIGDDRRIGEQEREGEQQIGDDRREDRREDQPGDDRGEQQGDVRREDRREDDGIFGGISKFFGGIFGFIFGSGEAEAEKEVPSSGQEVEQEITGKAAADDVAVDDNAATDDKQVNKNKGPLEAIGDFFTGLFGPKLDSSGKGYPTGVLIMSVPSTQLIVDREGQVKGQLPNAEVKDRQYEGTGQLPVTIGGTLFYATEIKVISNLKANGGTGQHQGIVVVDIDNLADPARAGHLELEYQGSATVGSSLSGTTIISAGNYKTGKVTGMFAGLVASGVYTMAVLETGAAFGSPVTISVTTE